MQLHIYTTADAVIEGLAKWITAYVTEILLHQERFTIALSGGETPKALYKLLATDAYREKIDWRKMHIFWGDERFVSFTDDKNNAKMAFDNLLHNVVIPPANIHKMQTDIEPELSAKAYEQVLHQYFDGSANSFDLVLNGMGKDGHTLSLFPSSPVLPEKNWVNAVFVKDQDMHRLTLMPSIVNKAAAIVFLVTGVEKAKIVSSVVKNKSSDNNNYPVQLIQPVNGEVHWFLDNDAASALP